MFGDFVGYHYPRTIVSGNYNKIIYRLTSDATNQLPKDLCPHEPRNDCLSTKK